jgi:hypothetical protein
MSENAFPPTRSNDADAVVSNFMIVSPPLLDIKVNLVGRQLLTYINSNHHTIFAEDPVSPLFKGISAS